ncbi:MAG: DUF4185 domain-containing protein [Balneolaceae bacterium]
MRKRFFGKILILALIATSGCSNDPTSSEPDPPDSPDPPSGEIPSVVDPDITIDMRSEKISQLVGDYDNERDEPTQNQTFSRYQLRATDLGAPFQDGDITWIPFGDTWGAAGGELDALAYTTDSNPEDGLDLDFIDDENGIYRPIAIQSISQGAFEVPMEGLMVDDEMYIYHTTDHNPPVTMGRSVVATTDNPDDAQFTYLYDFSSRNFINVSIVQVESSDWELLPEEENGKGLVILGSGSYRESDVYLAYQPQAEIRNRKSIQYFAGVDENDEPLWSSGEDDSVPLFEHPCVGELSVSYNEFIDRWILLYNCSNPRGITMRTAENPWGPWTKSQVIFDPWQDGGYCNYIHVSWVDQNCDSVHDPGRQNEYGGEYGPYQFEHFATGDDQSTTIYFTMSIWNPYTVVLMKAGLKKEITTSNENLSYEQQNY